MSGHKLIETTGPFALYYGAELNAAEWAEFYGICEHHDPVPASQNIFWASFGERILRPLDSQPAPQIGRMRGLDRKVID
jgi:hypothetical protein